MSSLRFGLKPSYVSFGLLLALFLLGACGGGGDSAPSIVDGDTPENESILDGDADGDADGDNAENEAGKSFVYDACKNPDEGFFFPNPLWEEAGSSPTGVVLVPPPGDKAALLLKNSKKSGWYTQLEGLDGFPRYATWIIGLGGQTLDDVVNMTRTKLFTMHDGAVSEVTGWVLRGALSENRETLIVTSAKPLPPLPKGDRYVLAVYSATITGVKPMPVCDNGTAHQAYVDAADAIVAAGQGKDLVFALPSTVQRTSTMGNVLYPTLKNSPKLEVESVTAFDSFDALKAALCPAEDSAKDPACAIFSDYPEPIAASKEVLADKFYRGILVTPLYQDENGIWRFDASSGGPLAKGTTKPGFFLALPKTGSAPYPVAIFQHGGSRFKYDLLIMAKSYAEKGIALLGIDLPYHGDRPKDAGKTGSDTDMADLSSPLKTRDNFRQASADQLTLITGLAALNTALASKGAPAKTLDEGKVFYVGHSMGALSGAITSSLCDRLTSASLIAGGAPYSQLLSGGIFALALTSFFSGHDALEKTVLMALAQLLLDGGDPVHFPGHAEDQNIAPKDVLLWEALRDPVMTLSASEDLARAFGAVLAKPFTTAVDGMEARDLPISNNYSFTGGTAKATRVLVQHDYGREFNQSKIHMQIFLDSFSHAAAANCFAKRSGGQPCELTLAK